MWPDRFRALTSLPHSGQNTVEPINFSGINQGVGKGPIALAKRRDMESVLAKNKEEKKELET